MPVRVIPVKYGGRLGYDLAVTGEGATVQDYLDALCAAMEKEPFYRAKNAGGRCEGCPLCCAERAPLTYIDVLRLMGYTGFSGGLLRFLDQSAFVVASGRVVDIVLRRGEDDFCIFLNRKNCLCAVYPARPLVCRTYICSPLSRRAAKLKELVVNAGEDELVRRWLEEGCREGRRPVPHAGVRPRPRLSDWEPNAFTGRSCYREVLLKEICPPAFWRELRL